MLLMSVQVIFVVDTVVSYYCVYYEYYLNRRYMASCSCMTQCKFPFLTAQTNDQKQHYINDRPDSTCLSTYKAH